MIDYDKTIEISVKSDDFTRLDRFVSKEFPDFSRSKICSLIESGDILVNGCKSSKNYKTKKNDLITVFIPKPKEYIAVAEKIDLDVVFEDEHIIVVNKPKGMVVHPAHGNFNGTLVNALLYHCRGSLSGINGVLRPGIVHRIDKDTSGLLVVAKNDIAHNHLASQFKDHSIEREYRTIVFGNFKDDAGTIDRPIGRHPNDRKKMSSSAKISKRAVTHFEVIERYNGFTYLKCKLETGRTHQIRVHMSEAGHYVLGDLVYGRKNDRINLDFEGQCLHAKTLGFIHPVTNEFLRFDSNLPEYFSNTLNKISKL